MARYRFNATGLVAFASYRIDTVSGSTSAATIESLQTAGSGISSTLRTDANGELPGFAGAVAALYAKQLTPSGVVTGSPTTLTGTLLDATAGSNTPEANTGAFGLPISVLEAEMVAHELRSDNPHGMLANQLVDWPDALPIDHGFVAWPHDPSRCSATGSLPAGTIVLIKMRLTKNGPLTSVVTNYSGGSGVTGGYVGAYVQQATNLIQVGVSAESSAAFNSGGDQVINFAAATGNYPAGQVIWVGLLAVGGTPPSIPAAPSTFRNSIGLTAATGFRYATFGAGKSSLDTSIPMASMNSNNNNFFVAVK